MPPEEIWDEGSTPVAGEEYDDEPDDEEEGDEWEGPSQDEWQQMVHYQQQTAPVMQQLGQYLNAPPDQQQYYDPNQVQEDSSFDPYDENSVQQYIQQNIQAGIEQALGPWQNLLGSIASREGETVAKGELERIAGQVGEFDKDNAYLVASSLIEQGADPPEALQKAAMYSREFEQRIRADEREKYKAELQQIAGAPMEAGTGSSSATENLGVPTGPDRYKIAVARALGNGHADIPVG